MAYISLVFARIVKVDIVKKSNRHSALHNTFSSGCFMKQKCQVQMGIAQYRNEATTLRTRGIDTAHQHYQMRYITLF